MSIQAIRASWILILAVLAGLLVAGPAHAHSDLRSSDPVDGSSLAAAPAQVSFTFNERLLAQGNAITVTEVASGQRLSMGAPEVDGETVTVAWPAVSPAGEYRAAYRVVSADGHPINGTITFAVAPAAGSAAPAATASPAPATANPAAGTAVGGQSPVPDPMGPTDATSPVPVGAPASPPDDGAGSSLLVLFVALGVAIVLGAVGGALFMRRAR
ncbi:MAG: copper resistance CopC family protein [Candidatus Nanopelagicales bacterium]